MSNGQDSNTKAPIIETELTRSLYAQGLAGAVATVINVSILTGVLWSVLPTTPLLSWYFSMIAIIGARFLLARRYGQLPPSEAQETRWRRRYILGTTSTGIAWGSLCLLLFPSDLLHQVFVAFVFASMSAGAVTILASVPLAALSFFLPMLAPLAFQFFRQGSDLGVAMGTMIVIFLGTLLFAVRHLYASTVETLDLRFSRLALEDSLRARETRYRELFENANDGIATFTLEGIITSVNRGLEYMLGRSRAEMVGHHHSEFATAASSTLASERTRRALAEEKLPSFFELELLHKNGAVVPVEGRARLMRDQNGAVIGVQTVFRDITKRKQTEEKLRKAHEELEQRVQERTAKLHQVNQQLTAEIVERQHAEEERRHSEAYFRTLIEDGSDLIAIIGGDGAIKYASPSHTRLLGYELTELVGKDAFSLMHPDDAGAVLTAFNAGLQEEGASGPVEFRFRHKDGSWRRLESLGKNLLEDPIIAGVLINSRDITERHAAEAALAESEGRYRALVESTYDLIQSVEPKGRFLFVNEAWSRTLGYTPEEVAQLHFLDIIHPECQSHCQEMFARVVAGKSIRDVQTIFLAKDGRHVPVEGNVAGRYLDGQLVALHGFFRDISERQQVEKEKQALQEQLAQAQKLQSLGTLAGGVAHDFNNLLTPIIGFSELLKRTAVPGTVAYNNIEEILKASHRAKELVQQMLAFSRPSQQAQFPIAMTELVKDCLALLRAGLSTTIEIHTSFDDEAGMVLANPTQLHQVIMNLGVNALQAMKEQGGKLDIAVRQAVVDETFAIPHSSLMPGLYCQLTVRDTGCGMSPDVQARIFDPFFTTKEIGQGSGLGLSVVHGIVSSYGGAIQVDSAPGKGSTFTVYLPCVDLPVTVAAEELQRLPRGRGRVLVVDDEQAVARLAGQMLTDLGYEATPITESREAVGLFQQDPDRFDVLITDQIMVGIKGVDLALAVRASRPTLPIIICSGSQLTLPEALITAGGPVRCLKKPFTLECLAEALHQALCPEEETHL